MTARSVLGMAKQAMTYVPLGFWQRIQPDATYIFNYHIVSSQESLPHVSPLFAFKNPEQFEADLRWIQHHFEIVDEAELQSKRAKSGRPLAHLTFDDGYRECLDVVAPLLDRYSIPATFFIVSDWVGGDRFFYRNLAAVLLTHFDALETKLREPVMNEAARVFGREFASIGELASFVKGAGPRDEDSLRSLCMVGGPPRDFIDSTRPYLDLADLRRLASKGHKIGAHGTNHTRLGELDIDGQTEEVRNSCQAIAEMTSESTVPFAFPFHQGGVNISQLRQRLESTTEVGAFYGSFGISREPGVWNRILADQPDMSRLQTSNLSHAVRRAHASAFAKRRRSG